MNIRRISTKAKLILSMSIVFMMILLYLAIEGTSPRNIILSIIIVVVITVTILQLAFKSFEKQIITKDREIMGQRDEISALYQEAVAMNEQLYSVLDELKMNYLSTVRALANSIEASDKYTKGHCERVTQYALKVAEAMKFSVDDMLKLEFAGLLHDIGKIGIPSSVLNKVGKLDNEEFQLIKSHPTIGYDILKDIEFLKDSTAIMLEHHERIDGRGYPLGKTGEKLNMLSKILAAADSYDAMTSSRPYRTCPLTIDEAIEQLIRGKESQFDSKVVDVFIELLKSNQFSSLQDSI